MFKIIAAIGNNRELGFNNQLLWNLKTDLQRFKKLTEGKTVLMGRKTYESIPEKFRPLPNRKNIILSRNSELIIPDVEIINNLESLVCQDIRVIGGGEIYKKMLDSAEELHITHVDGDFIADTFFPGIDLNMWKVLHEEEIPSDEKNSHNSTYKIYKRLTRD